MHLAWLNDATVDPLQASVQHCSANQHLEWLLTSSLKFVWTPLSLPLRVSIKNTMLHNIDHASFVRAVRGGANRLELCGNIGIGGGTTPSMGLFKQVKRASPNIPIMVMIRPRTGDFYYTFWEVDVMVEDIRAFKAAGAQGVVFGALDAYGKVDVRTTSRFAFISPSVSVSLCSTSTTAWPERLRLLKVIRCRMSSKLNVDLAQYAFTGRLI